MSEPFDAQRWRPASFLPEEDARDPALLFVVAVLCFLACLTAPLSHEASWLGISLFLLGLGWNFCFISGSAMLSAGGCRRRLASVKVFPLWHAAHLPGPTKTALSRIRMCPLGCLVPVRSTFHPVCQHWCRGGDT